MYDTTNIFAKILKKFLPCQKVYEDEYCLAFHDLHPKAPVHIIIIPKNPFVSFSDFSAQAEAKEIAHFFKAIGQIAKQLKIDASGYRLIMNHGKDGGQEVPHFHVHLLGGKTL